MPSPRLAWLSALSSFLPSSSSSVPVASLVCFSVCSWAAASAEVLAVGALAAETAAAEVLEVLAAANPAVAEPEATGNCRWRKLVNCRKRRPVTCDSKNK
uniref:Uncharacterized protein n=1 Tax=mine drainage metagenome TaxID=410659 RepID=E6PZ92_9ZZZZ